MPTMLGHHPIQDTKRVVRAALTNQLARFAPKLYVRLTGQTGRGSAEETAEEIAAYFRKCFDEYFRVLKIAPQDISGYLPGKQILEYGPGDVPGVALLMIAHGAERVTCVDRFPLVALSPKNIEVLRCLLQKLEGEARVRAASCFRQPGEPVSGLDARRIRYLVRPSGLSSLQSEIDIVMSRAVLEHVNDLDATFHDMFRALRQGGIAVHQVDLKSHGLHRHNPLDFLAWPAPFWYLMYSHKGVPNRWRVDRYRAVLARAGFKSPHLEATLLAQDADIQQVRPYLAKPFRNISDADLSWLGFWLVCAK